MMILAFGFLGVELTKKYGADEDYQFVNGLLGAVARDHGLDAEQAEQ